MEITTSSLIAAGQGFSTLQKSNAGNKGSDTELSQKPASVFENDGDSVEISSDVLSAAKLTAEIQSHPQPGVETEEVVVQLEIASSNAEAVIYQNVSRSADTATQALGNSADITV